MKRKDLSARDEAPKGGRRPLMRLTLLGQGLGESPEARQAVGAQLVEDAGQHLGQLLGLGVAGDGEGVGSEGGLHFGVVEVDDCALVCEHVNLQSTTEVKR